MAINVNFSGITLRVPGYYGGPPWMCHKSKQHWQLYKLLNMLDIATLNEQTSIPFPYEYAPKYGLQKP